LHRRAWDMWLLIAACGLHAPPVSRRAAVGAAVASALTAPPAWANNDGAARYASGYVPPPNPLAVAAQLKSEFYVPFAKALSSADAKKVSSFYDASATVVQGGAFVKGSDMSSYVAGRASLDLSVGNIVLEGETLDIAHVTYNAVPASGGKAYQGLQRVVRKNGAWTIDEDVSPLDNGKVYNMIKPQRNLLTGKVFMALDPALRL